MCEIRLPYAREGLDAPIQSVNEYISFSEVDVVEAVENVKISSNYLKLKKFKKIKKALKERKRYG